MHNLKWEETRITRQIEFHSIIRFRIISKIIMNPKDKSFTIAELWMLFWMAAFKAIATDKDMFNVGIKVAIIASIDVILMFLI